MPHAAGEIRLRTMTASSVLGSVNLDHHGEDDLAEILQARWPSDMSAKIGPYHWIPGEEGQGEKEDRGGGTTTAPTARNDLNVYAQRHIKSVPLC